MSELNGFFSLRTPRDLLAKLESDHDRLRAAASTSVDAQYAAYDFFVTAQHLSDWQSHAVGGSLSSHRAYADGALVDDVASGAKHFRVDPKRHGTVSDTRSAGAFQADAFQSDAFDVARLVVDLEDGDTVEVTDVASRVLAHWRTVLA